MSYVSVRRLASKLTKKFGQEVIATLRTTGTFDPVAASYPGDTVTEIPIDAVVLPVDRGTKLDDHFLSGRVIANMRKVITSYPGLIPGMEISFGGASWNVIDTSIVDPDGSGSIITLAYVEKH